MVGCATQSHSGVTGYRSCGDATNDTAYLDAAASVDTCQSNESAETTVGAWQTCTGLQVKQRELLQALYTRGVVIQDAAQTQQQTAAQQEQQQQDRPPNRRRYRLSYAGEVAPDGNCLFSSTAVALGGSPSDAAQLRRRAVQRFRADCESGCIEEGVDQVISNLYSPDLTRGWGVHFVQQHKLILRRSDVQQVQSAVEQLQLTGMDAHQAYASAYKDVCTPVTDALSWAEYMSVDGSEDASCQVVTLQYVEDGLLSATVDGTAAFGDDIAIQSLANELNREIIVVQVHAASAMEDEAALFFFPHIPKNRAPAGASCGVPQQQAPALPMQQQEGAPQGPPQGPQQGLQMPLFLLMKGLDFQAQGADHYEPMYVSKMIDDGSEPAFVV